MYAPLDFVAVPKVRIQGPIGGTFTANCSYPFASSKLAMYAAAPLSHEHSKLQHFASVGKQELLFCPTLHAVH